MNTHDVGQGPAELNTEIASGTPDCVGLRVLQSPYGHDGFLIETEQVGQLAAGLLAEPAAAGVPKAVAAARAVGRINSELSGTPMVADVTPDNVERLVAGADVVVDGTDNVETRYLLNDACLKHGIPWVYGGAIGATGMAMVILPGESACFRSLYPAVPAPGTLATCEPPACWPVP